MGRPLIATWTWEWRWVWRGGPGLPMVSHGAPGAAGLMGKIAPTDTKLLILWGPGFINPDLVCTLHSAMGDTGKGRE